MMEKRYCIDIGGVYYFSTESTLRKSPTLNAAIQQHSQEQEDIPLFVDRDGGIFHHVLYYLRNNSVPSLEDSSYIEMLVVEAGYFGLRGMELQLSRQLSERANSLTEMQRDIREMRFILEESVLQHRNSRSTGKATHHIR